MTYRPGGFWRIDDFSGFRVRAYDTVKQWDGAIVHRNHADIRNPQDFVRGRKDNQTVPDPRPDAAADTFLGPLTTTTTAAAVAGATSISVASSVRMEAGDDIGIMLEEGSTHRAVIDTVPTSTSITLTSATKLPHSMASGALVIDYDAVSLAQYGQ